MRLNVGCGNNYLPGYVNVDIDDNGIADRKATAHALDFVKDGSAEEIASYQLIEHLGLPLAYRTAAHWARKLRPGGRLVIETLDLGASLWSLEKRPSRKNADWLFGTSDPGQNHVRPLYFEELKEMLRSVGFHKITKSEPLGYWKRNALRVEALMGKEKGRARVAEGWCSLPMDQGIFYSLPLNALPERPSKAFLIETALVSPELVRVFPAHEKWAGRLQRHKLVERMFCALLDRPLDAKPDQGKAVKTVVKRASSIARRAAAGKDPGYEEMPLEKRVQRLLAAYPHSNFFCPHSINELAMHYCALGIAAFSNKEFETARERFRTSLGFHRENTIAWWNLARVLRILGEDASGAFDNALRLSGDPEIKREMRRGVPYKMPKELSHAVQV